jgi:hypothetical protein
MGNAIGNFIEYFGFGREPLQENDEDSSDEGRDHESLHSEQDAMLLNDHLSLDDLDDIINVLTACRFPKHKWLELGLRLGILIGTLEGIDEHRRGDPSRCLIDCLSKWLSGVDNAKDASFDVLVDSLESIEEKLSSKKLQEIVNCRKILQKYQSHLLKVDYPVEIVQRLQKEDIIKTEAVDSCSIFKELYANRVVAEHRNLLQFAGVLRKLNSNLADNIISDYNAKFPGVSSLPSSVDSKVEIRNPELKTEYHRMQCKFGRLLHHMAPLISSVPLDDLKKLIIRCHSELKSSLDSTESFDDVMFIIQKKCSVVDIALLESIVDEYKITDPDQNIKEYKEELEKFCQDNLISCYHEKLKYLDDPLLKCETICFIVDWNPEKTTFEDIKQLIHKTFYKLSKKVEVTMLKDDQSITIICYAPHHLMDMLLIEAEGNIHRIKEMGLLQLTIGYYTLYRKKNEISTLPEQSNLENTSEKKDLEEVICTLMDELESKNKDLKMLLEKLDTLRTEKKTDDKHGHKEEINQLPQTFEEGAKDEMHRKMWREIETLRSQLKSKDEMIMEKNKNIQSLKDDLSRQFFSDSSFPIAQENERIKWYSCEVRLYSPTEEDWEIVKSQLACNNEKEQVKYKQIQLYNSSPDITTVILRQLDIIATISEVRVYNTTFNVDSLHCLCQLNYNQRLHTLLLYECILTRDGLKEITQSLMKNTVLVHLHLHRIQFTTDVDNNDINNVISLLLTNEVINVVVDMEHRVYFEEHKQFKLIEQSRIDFFLNPAV